MKKEIKVGIFVALGVMLFGVIVFIVGDNRHVWARKLTYVAMFTDVAGLKPGAPVRMGGVEIGSVTSANHGEVASDPRIRVAMDIVRSDATRIRTDTVARIVNKGLLGDKMIELSIAPFTSPQLDPATPIRSEEPVDISRYLSQFEGIAKKTERVVENAERATGALADPQFTEDVKGAAKSLHAILDGIALQDGAAHRMIFDPETGKKLDRTLTNLDGATANLNAALADTRDVAAQVKRGPGLAHALVYESDVSADAAGALKELHEDLAAVRQGNGLLHALVYGDTDAQHLMGNVNAMSDDMREIVANMKAGKGTLGALLVDPSIYEDIRSLVGNVDRNQVLRALVRYSIKADEKSAPKVETPSTAAPKK